MPRILFVHSNPSRFVVIDRDLLAQRWEVHEWYQRSRWIDLPGLWAAVRKSDVVFGWFASWHTFVPVTMAWLLGKPVVQVSGGYDVANLPEIGYGHQRGGLRRFVSRWIIHRATRLVTNSYYSQQEIMTNVGLPAEQIHVVHHGLPDAPGAPPTGPRKPIVLSVGNVNHSNLTRKGHLPFIQASKLVPEMTFVLAGKWQDDAIDLLKAEAGPNVVFTDWLDAETLDRYFRESMVYVQASQHEGFGVSVVEAMLAGCIPVSSRMGALPEVIGDVGVYIAANEPAAVADGIRQALRIGDAGRAAVRERALRHFSLDMRGRGLSTMVEEALAARRSPS
jgi:glycosyltransferase involved in cell wall biosynthesis